HDGQPVYLPDIWPDPQEIADYVARYVTQDRFAESYGAGMETTKEWEALEAADAALFPWNPESAYIRPSPFPFLKPPPLKSGRAILSVRPLLVLGDAITTDHISPNGAIRIDSPAGKYLVAQGNDPQR